MARPAKRSADFVTVACKHPQGLVVPVQGLLKPVRLHGSHSPYARHGFGMTEVPADVWDAILEQYGERTGTDRFDKPCKIPQAAWLANKIVFAHADTRSTNAEAKEHEALKTGLEPIDPRKPHETPGASLLPNGFVQPEGADDPGQPGLN